MVSTYDKWTRIFDVAETSRHRKGFTIYKIISMLYPEDCPDAITKVTVWKRYNDFKKLHRDLKSKHRHLHLKDRFPSLPNNPFFKRFDKEVINERKGALLKFLEYVARHPELFMCNEFVKFFETSHTPTELLNGSINSIRADLQLPIESEFVTTPNSDDEPSLSDTDSVSTLSSLNHLGQTIDFLSDPLHKTSRSSKIIKRPSLEHDSLSISTISETADEELLQISSSCNYIIEAARIISEATEQETAKNYESAFASYKAGIDVLLRHVKSDKDVERRRMVRHKIEKYLLRAEKIYNVYLSPEIKNIQELVKVEKEIALQEPLSDLHKYKVIKVIGGGMLVLHSESQQLFYVKVIYKSWNFSIDNLILPENVPYMIRLYNFYNCENALFLILEYCCGIKLIDYIRRETKYQQQQPVGDINSEDESESSYADLVNDYVTTRYLDELTLPTAKNEDVSNDDVSSESPPPPAQQTFEATKKNEAAGMERQVSEDFDIQEEYFAKNRTDVVKWAAQLLVALEKLHAAGVICCDLDFKNLLVDDYGNLRLTYMCSVTDDKTFRNKSSLTLAPELCGFDSVTPAVDWWSYGAILYELLSGLSLKAVHPEGVFSYTALKIPKFVSPEGRSLVKQLLAYEPLERLGCGVNGTDDIKSHPFFSCISWEIVAAGVLEKDKA